jgi:hypothetical protein
MLGATVQNVFYPGNLAPRTSALLFHTVMEVERSANNEERSDMTCFSEPFLEGVRKSR